MATISVEDLKKMKVNDLKKELKDRGLPTSGTKDVLLERLQAALDGTEPISSVTAENNAVEDNDSVEKSIDQLVGDTIPTAPEAPVESTPVPVVTSKENIPEKTEEPASKPEKKVVSLTVMPEADRMKARAEKFGGAVSDSAKKLMRAERFGLSASSSSGSTNTVGISAPKSEDMEKMKKRAERFGTVVSNKLSKVDEDERKRKRLERFGAASTSPTEIKKVKLSSTDSDMEEKKKKRAERFGLTS